MESYEKSESKAFLTSHNFLDVDAEVHEMEEYLKKEKYNDLQTKYNIDEKELEVLKQLMKEYNFYSNQRMMKEYSINSMRNSLAPHIEIHDDTADSYHKEVLSRLERIAKLAKRPKIIEAINNLSIDEIDENLMDVLVKNDVKVEDILDNNIRKYYELYLQNVVMKNENKKLQLENEGLKKSGERLEYLNGYVERLEKSYKELYDRFNSFVEKVYKRTKINDERYKEAQCQISELTNIVQDVKSMGIITFLKHKISGFKGLKENTTKVLPAGLEEGVKFTEEGTTKDLENIKDEYSKEFHEKNPEKRKEFKSIWDGMPEEWKKKGSEEDMTH